MNKIFTLLLIAAAGFVGMKFLEKKEEPVPVQRDTTADLARGKSLLNKARYYERLAANPGRRPSPADLQKMQDHRRKAAEFRAQAAALGVSAE